MWPGSRFASSGHRHCDNQKILPGSSGQLANGKQVPRLFGPLASAWVRPGGPARGLRGCPGAHTDGATPRAGATLWPSSGPGF